MGYIHNHFIEEIQDGYHTMKKLGYKAGGCRINWWRKPCMNKTILWLWTILFRTYESNYFVNMSLAIGFTPWIKASWVSENI